ncbi:MGMT family protein [Lederbergia wuyishanensis]|uniref:Methylated-DNA-protein-cysteine methyltransferase-like protein n=1 Tax=Lederbergia wuyishanensis TaxID=1347903 RepID=A0ABU0DB94_9BACI|nr:MGMT family protein [Lederbergia wuyishanensis]MCJ8010066.1 MGMT family protein [Lederbergia wuyishanensis]MDQ0345580.1 methylated-DNA-protein-cysteine methyltransferase-like protein [Lederbergia wuyishanensis]
MNPFTEKVIAIIQSIPRGSVATYGQIARLAGSPRGARQVSRILHSMSSKYKLPWHRVVNAKGEIVIADPETAFQQQLLLESEGIEVIKNNQINLHQYQWKKIEDPHWE